METARFERERESNTTSCMETGLRERERVTLPPAWKQLGLRGERESNTTSCMETGLRGGERE